MALLTTGLINNTEVSGVRPSSTLSVRITNHDPVSATINIRAFYMNGTSMTEYVSDLLILVPEGVSNYDYYTQFDVFEFRFITNSDAVEILVCGKNAAGDLTLVHNLLPAELISIGAEGIDSSANQIYVASPSRNHISVIEGKTNTIKGNITVGSGPLCIGVNSITNRIYVANFGSNNVTVVDGVTDNIITTIPVSTHPRGVGINPTTNQIYVANQGSDNVSVIDGFSNTVIANIMVGASPEVVDVNPITNRIYVTNLGSNKVSVINGSTNTVIATIEI
jgi:YVTN family beta-propeller protein